MAASNRSRWCQNPPGAQVTVDDDPVAYTAPATITLKRGQDHVLVFHNNGYQDYSAKLTPSTSGVVLGNIIVGGLTGIITDYGSGAAYDSGNADLVNDTVTIRLAPKALTVSVGPPTNPLAPALNSEPHPE